MLKPPSITINPQAKEIESKMKWWAIHTNLPVNVRVRLSHPRCRASRNKETSLAPSAGKPTGNYDIECWQHHPSLSTLRRKGLSRNKMKRWAIHTNQPVDVIVSLPHPRSGDSHGQEWFLAASAQKQTPSYYIECWKHHPSISTIRPKWLSRSKMKWWAIYNNLPV